MPKNDVLDSCRSHLAAAIDQVREASDPRLAELAEQLTFVEHEDDIKRCKTRLEHIDQPALQRLVLGDSAGLKAWRLAQFPHLARQMRAHPDLAARLDLVLSIPGIGERTGVRAVDLHAALGQISREEAAALAGLAPLDKDNGQYKGQRRIPGGRARLRRSLFRSPGGVPLDKALIALPLTAAGTAHNAALIACARNPLIYANTVVQRGTLWLESTIMI
ncbi:transposase [Bradyrhizobium embrapense]|uniref:transposase n=1 Tax=Bradyrhizobium embrapense TaxID=630921 RepID=UPI00067AE99A|nr:transposase [Bradyrhizobium embrapense]